MGFSVEILSVGNELLIGKTTNTNLTWLSGQLNRLEGFVRRAIIVRDDIGEIAEAFRQALEHDPDVVITSGGLGPTFDDKTLQGLAYASGVSIVLDTVAMSMVEERVQVMNSARLKMAHIPAGGKPLPNPVGTAPGVHLTVSNAEVFALPGVPSEMRAIFKDSVLKFLRKTFQVGSFFESSFQSLGVPESMLAPYIDECMARFPAVYVKSHPLGVEKGRSKINLHLTSYQSAKSVDEAVKMLAKRIRGLGGVVPL